MLFAPVLTSPSLRSFDRSLERFLNQTAHAVPATSGVKGHTFEQTDQHYTLSLDIPGVSREQLRLAIEGAVVRLETVTDAPRTVKAAYEFSQELDVANSSAKLENGVLTLTLAKKQPESRSTQLTIQ